MKNKINSREFLHSLSRINDRINQSDKDLNRFRREFNSDIKALYEDFRLIRSAFDSLYRDLMGNNNKKTKKEVSRDESNKELPNESIEVDT